MVLVPFGAKDFTKQRGYWCSREWDVSPIIAQEMWDVSPNEGVTNAQEVWDVSPNKGVTSAQEMWDVSPNKGVTSAQEVWDQTKGLLALKGCEKFLAWITVTWCMSKYKEHKGYWDYTGQKEGAPWGKWRNCTPSVRHAQRHRCTSADIKVSPLSSMPGFLWRHGFQHADSKWLVLLARSLPPPPPTG